MMSEAAYMEVYFISVQPAEYNSEGMKSYTLYLRKLCKLSMDVRGFQVCDVAVGQSISDKPST